MILPHGPVRIVPLRVLAWTLCLAFSASAASAQQQNSGGASMLVNGAMGPPYPITTTINTGSQTSIQLGGNPNKPFMLMQHPELQLTGLDLGSYGILHLPFPGLSIIADGWANPGLYTTNVLGQWAVAFQVPAGLPQGATMSYQAVVADPGNPVGLTLTAATKITINVAQTVITHTLGEDDFVAVNLNSYGGLSIPFYLGTYTTYYVNANGSVSFTAGSTTYTPSVGEFNSSVPRIALKWSDLSPQNGGLVRSTIDTSGVEPTVLVEFINVPDYLGGPTHTMSTRMGTQTGTIDFIQSPQSPWSWYDHMAGIGPGQNQSPVTTPKDLSALHAAGGMSGLPKESFFEMFRGATTTSSFPPWDLTGVTIQFLAVGAGTPQVFYLML